MEQADSGAASAITLLAEELRADRAEARADRRRTRRNGWIRWGVFVALALSALAITTMRSASALSDAHIARVEVVGMIANDPARDRLFREIAENDAIKAVILRIDSPGGTTVGGEALYVGLRGIAEKKPVVAVMGEVAASAAYMTAIAADHIVARGNTITASVGVIFTAPNFHGALENLGLEVQELRSGARKAQPSPFQPVDLGKLEEQRELIDEIFEWFVALVQERRALSAGTVALIRDGRVVTGRRALALGLVDEIGGEPEALAWLETERDVSASLELRDYEPTRDEPGVLGGVFGAALREIGLDLSDASARLEQATRGPAAVSELR